MSWISEEKKTAIRTRINNLYTTCGSISPIIYFIDALTKEFNSIIGNNSKAFEARLGVIERRIELYYNREGIDRAKAESDTLNHLMVYVVRNNNDVESRYFYHLELANLFIKDHPRNTDYRLSKIYNGYSVEVKTPVFFH